MNIHHFETLPSTQDIAKQYLAEGKELPFAVRADVQTKGRGRGGNQWVSPVGNLYSSIVIPLDAISPRYAGQYSFVTAIALMDCLAEYGVTQAVNKWPNDILVNGQKIAGILLESDSGADGFLNALIIGVGVNINHAPDGAVALVKCMSQGGKGQQQDCAEFLSRFLVHLHNNFEIIRTSGFAPIHEKWLSKAHGIGTEIRVRLPSETFYGEFIGLDKDGALQVWVAGESTPRIIHAGEVFFGM